MEAANKAIEVWINFGQMSSEGILDCFKDNSWRPALKDEMKKRIF